jgi:hypothetical protein
MNLIVKIGEKNKQDFPNIRVGKSYLWVGKKM